jgi:hypothetical protein
MLSLRGLDLEIRMSEESLKLFALFDALRSYSSGETVVVAESIEWYSLVVGR